MDKFEGETLLMLGTNVSSVDIIKYAKRHGAKTIVADYLPKEKSEAKQYADLSYLISTADTDGLQKIIDGNNVTAVLAGISEFNLAQAMRLAKKNGFRFYCTQQQWESIENKKHFRELCHQYGVPCPRTFYCGSAPKETDICELPVIVKPVDGSASNGVSICRTRESLIPALGCAKNESRCGEVIVEEFFEGDEFTAHYAIIDGIAHFISMDERHPALLHGGNTASIPIGRTYPSTYLAKYRQQVDAQVAEMCHNIGLQVGVLFVQGLYNTANGRFCIFEAGLRSAGEAPFRFLEHIYGWNYLHDIVDYCMTGATDIRNLDGNMVQMGGKRCCIASFASPGGTIAKIEGLKETLEKCPEVIYHEARYHEGDTLPEGDTLRQIVLRFFIVADNDTTLAHTIRQINEGIAVLDSDGRDICVRFDPTNLSKHRHI